MSGYRETHSTKSSPFIHLRLYNFIWNTSHSKWQLSGSTVRLMRMSHCSRYWILNTKNTERPFRQEHGTGLSSECPHKCSLLTARGRIKEQAMSLSRPHFTFVKSVDQKILKLSHKCQKCFTSTQKEGKWHTLVSPLKHPPSKMFFTFSEQYTTFRASCKMHDSR